MHIERTGKRGRGAVAHPQESRPLVPAREPGGREVASSNKRPSSPRPIRKRGKPSRKAVAIEPEDPTTWSILVCPDCNTPYPYAIKSLIDGERVPLCDATSIPRDRIIEVCPGCRGPRVWRDHDRLCEQCASPPPSRRDPAKTKVIGLDGRPTIVDLAEVEVKTQRHPAGSRTVELAHLTEQSRPFHVLSVRQLPDGRWIAGGVHATGEHELARRCREGASWTLREIDTRDAEVVCFEFGISFSSENQLVRLPGTDLDSTDERGLPPRTGEGGVSAAPDQGEQWLSMTAAINEVNKTLVDPIKVNMKAVSRWAKEKKILSRPCSKDGRSTEVEMNSLIQCARRKLRPQ